MGLNFQTEVSVKINLKPLNNIAKVPYLVGAAVDASVPELVYMTRFSWRTFIAARTRTRVEEMCERKILGMMQLSGVSLARLFYATNISIFTHIRIRHENDACSNDTRSTIESLSY